ncbi:PREDICTED: uncharacterized protein LOC109227931 [Nicotiana attenuata]|uniref:uncharacterized protein LOC109227931 n=1 Tax=Nicotiana attenuata TaxID=49451 RepID=UPI0009046756|nr:PREDICTED: uncharacterized protein LOC109227931 [Nicotiana attenuata]
MSNAKAIGTPMSPSISLDKDEQGIPVYETKYRGMIGSLLYLTASRLDIMFSVYKCAKIQSAPKESHLTAVKRIIRYLISTVSHGLWYPRSNTSNLEGFSNVDLAGDKEDKKSTSGTCQLLGKGLISWNSKKQRSVALSMTEAEYIAIEQCSTAIKDLLTTTQSIIGDIHAISKETGSDISKIRVVVLKVRENDVKAFKDVHDKLDGMSVSANASFDQLKEAICNTLTYFLRQ